jgi:hypothetical protein
VNGDVSWTMTFMKRKEAPHTQPSIVRMKIARALNGGSC